MKQHDANAKIIVDYLKNEPLVKDVLYPGKGGMLSFRLQESEWVDHFFKTCNSLHLRKVLAASRASSPTRQHKPMRISHVKNGLRAALRPPITFLSRCGRGGRFNRRFETSICEITKDEVPQL